MSEKISLSDLISNEQIEIEDYKSIKEKSLQMANKEDIYHFINTKRPRKDTLKRDKKFYEIVPKSKLESVISSILNKNDESVSEKRSRHIFKHNFDSKMQRIKRIKSKAYRRYKRDMKQVSVETDLYKKVENENINENNSIETKAEVVNLENHFGEMDDIEEAPIFQFQGSNDVNRNEEAVKLAFNEDMNENEAEFVSEKEGVIQDEAPKRLETVLAGWGDWAGPGLEIKKTKFNTLIEEVDGIKYAKRKDFDVSHIIINEKTPGVDEKYKSSIPYGYTREDYVAKMNMPISKECNTFRIFKKIIKPNVQNKKGEIIEPYYYEPENNI